MAQLTPRAVGKDIGHAAGDIVYTWRTPFRLDRRDWERAAVGTAGLALVSIVLDKRVDRWITAHPTSPVARAFHPFQDSVGAPAFPNIGTAPVLLPMSGILYAAGIVSTATDHDGAGRALRDAGLGCAAVNLTILTVRYASYLLVSRERPRTAAGDAYNFGVPGGDWAHQSFISGHVANSIGCATFMARRFDLGPAEPALFVVPLSIGAGRLLDRRHWTSDLALGILLGVGVGTAVANRSLERR